MSVLTAARSAVRHRKLSRLELTALAGDQDRELAVLRPRVTELEGAVDEFAINLDSALKLINGLRIQRDDALTIHDATNAKAVRCTEAEDRATAAEQALAEQTDELLALRAFRDNQLAMSDLSAQMQGPTAPPTTIQRFTVGRVVQAGASPHAAHIPQHVVDNDATQEIPKVGSANFEDAGVWPVATP